MLQDLTAAKIDGGLAKLVMDQMEGNAPPPGQVSLGDIARRSGVSEATVLKIERVALAKLHAAITQDSNLLSALNIKL